MFCPPGPTATKQTAKVEVQHKLEVMINQCDPSVCRLSTGSLHHTPEELYFIFVSQSHTSAIAPLIKVMTGVRLYDLYVILELIVYLVEFGVNSIRSTGFTIL